MKYGFLKVCAKTPDIKVCDCKNNADEIIKSINEAYASGVSVSCFP